MKYVFIYLMMTIFEGKLYVESPWSVKNLFNFNNISGGLEYSISTFGNILYNEKDEISLYIPPSQNKYGCDPIAIHPSDKNERFFYLVKRGICTYSKKAFVA